MDAFSAGSLFGFVIGIILTFFVIRRFNSHPVGPTPVDDKVVEVLTDIRKRGADLVEYAQGQLDSIYRDE